MYTVLEVDKNGNTDEHQCSTKTLAYAKMMECAAWEDTDHASILDSDGNEIDSVPGDYQ